MTKQANETPNSKRRRWDNDGNEEEQEIHRQLTWELLWNRDSLPPSRAHFSVSLRKYLYLSVFFFYSQLELSRFFPPKNLSLPPWPGGGVLGHASMHAARLNKSAPYSSQMLPTLQSGKKKKSLKMPKTWTKMRVHTTLMNSRVQHFLKENYKCPLKMINLNIKFEGFV